MIYKTKKKQRENKKVTNYIMIYSGVPEKNRAKFEVALLIKKKLSVIMKTYTFQNEDNKIKASIEAWAFSNLWSTCPRRKTHVAK